ncbi:MAG: hypothetical protein ABIR16_06625 [Dokdonella sp.]
MGIRSKIARGLAGTLLAFALAPAHADVMSLAPSGSGGVLIRNLQTQGMSESSVTVCCGSNAGTLAVASALDRAYFITGNSSSQILQTLPYALTTAPAGAALPAATRFTHAHYDTQRTRIVSLAFDAGAPSIQSINPATAATSLLKTVAPEWNSYRSGIIAYRPSTDLLYMVGRSTAQTVDRLLRFDLNSANSPLVPVDFDLTGEVVLALAVHPTTGVVYGLSKSLSNSITRLVRFDFTPGFAVVSLGVGNVDCCSVLVGSPAIDTGSNTLLAVTRNSAGTEPAKLRRFNLATGVVTELGSTVSAGLFEDTNPPQFDRIFANGFD